jgi:hypothetical protein
MMNYIPGQIHESLQKEHFFLINMNFSWMNCGEKRLSEMWCITDWDKTDTIELSQGDVLVVRFFKPSPTSETYTYLERIIYNNGKIIEYKKESIISKQLILVNSDDKLFGKEKFIFSNVTKSFERDKKIDLVFR